MRAETSLMYRRRKRRKTYRKQKGLSLLLPLNSSLGPNHQDLYINHSWSCLRNGSSGWFHKIKVRSDPGCVTYGKHPNVSSEDRKTNNGGIFIDELDGETKERTDFISNVCHLVGRFIKKDTRFKALLPNKQYSRSGSLTAQMLYIEYDKERKG